MPSPNEEIGAKKNRDPASKTEQKEKKNGKGRKYPSGTKLAVDLYGNGNFFEAELKNYLSANKHKNNNKHCLWANMTYSNDENTNRVVDLNVVEVVELLPEEIIALGDDNIKDEEKGYLGRRLTVQWSNGDRYTGMITRTMKSEKNFVFIEYDDGDRCWYSLFPDKEKNTRKEIPKGSTSNSASTVRKQSSDREQRMKNGTDNGDSNDRGGKEKKKTGAVVKDLEEEYPIGSTLAVDLNHDDNFYECEVKKYHKTSKENKDKLWLYVHEKDKKSSSKWIDLNVLSFFKITSEKINDLEKNEGKDAGFLGKRISVEWSDGNKYSGVVTKTMNDESNFVFIEYDDGLDKCWFDLQRDDSQWSILDGSKDNSKVDDASLDEKPKVNASSGNGSKRKMSDLAVESKKKQYSEFTGEHSDI